MATGSDHLRRLFLAACWPARLWIRWGASAKIRRGLVRVVTPALPPWPATFRATVAGGGLIDLYYRESLGTLVYLEGSFERAETLWLTAHARPGTLAIDCGAHAGFFTLALARAVTPAGRVLAIEPIAESVSRLEATLDLNGLAHVEVYRGAVGLWEHDTTLHIARDLAYTSEGAVLRQLATGEQRRVPCQRLDTLWEARDRPAVSALKIDVEGSEVAVLAGAQALLAACQPAVLVEAQAGPARVGCEMWLAEHGYVRQNVSGFEPWNHAFLPRQTHATGSHDVTTIRKKDSCA